MRAPYSSTTRPYCTRCEQDVVERGPQRGEADAAGDDDHVVAVGRARRATRVPNGPRTPTTSPLLQLLQRARDGADGADRVHQQLRAAPGRR